MFIKGKKEENEKKLIKFLLSKVDIMLGLTDINEFFLLRDGKITPMTKRGNKELSKNVTRSFMKQYVLPAFK